MFVFECDEVVVVFNLCVIKFVIVLSLFQCEDGVMLVDFIEVIGWLLYIICVVFIGLCKKGYVIVCGSCDGVIFYWVIVE